MPKISVVMPVFKVERFVAQAVESVLAQSFADFELIVVDDCSPDGSIAIVESYSDPRIRIIRHQENRGLAGARNTGIRVARADVVAFLDSDDTWDKDKLALHWAHLQARPEVGVSFSRSVFMTAEGALLPLHQMPKLRDIEAGYYLCRNPIGNGSAPVIRKSVLEAVAEVSCRYGPAQKEYFDESFRQSEDIECWIRIALNTQWVIEGIPQALTRYRLNAGGLSAALYKQLASWEQMVEKLAMAEPDFAAQHVPAARGYQLRYLARQAIRLGDGAAALSFVLRALGQHPGLLWQEPGRTVLTVVAAFSQRLLPSTWFQGMERAAQALLGRRQRQLIARQSQELAL